ncbi:MAG TPA: hypothetical protein ENJ93_04630 [Chloroflexi bacterium]|nr:hypothetical protein [Chloroflexota bacterium]
MNGRTKTQLAEFLAQHFSESELVLFASSLGVDYENLEGRSKKAKAFDLVAYMDRRGQTAALLKQIELERPHLSSQINEIWEMSSNNRPQKYQPSFSKTSTWLVGVGGIALFLLLAFVGWRWFVDGLGGEPTAVPDEITYQVKIQDVVSGMPVQQATVALTTSDGSAPDTQITDTNGIAVFHLPISQADSEAMVSVQKNGYRYFTQFITLKSEQLPQMILIEPDS